jgi:hypothetical protein
MAQTGWSEADYDSLSWHDNHVYGLEIQEGEHGTGELILHLDHIVEWLPPVDGACSFRIAPAILSFREVSGLKLALDYFNVSAAMTPFSIGEIVREAITYATGYHSYRWSISINWPEGLITFEAPGFTQRLLAAPVISSDQFLPASLRNAAIAGRAQKKNR